MCFASNLLYCYKILLYILFVFLCDVPGLSFFYVQVYLLDFLFGPLSLCVLSVFWAFYKVFMHHFPEYNIRYAMD